MENFFDYLLSFLSELGNLFSSADSITGNVDSISGNIGSIFESMGSIAASGASIAAAGVFVICLCIAALSLLLDVIVYLFRTICLVKLAKKAGRSDGWLAFIPIAWHFVLCDLSDAPFKLFGKQWFRDRRIAFWVWLGVKYLGGLIISLISGTICSVLMLIPVIGQVIGPRVGILLPFVPLVLSACMRYRFLYDATEVFRPGRRNNKTLSVLSILVEELLSTDFMTLILLWSMVRGKPAVQPEE